MVGNTLVEECGGRMTGKLEFVYADWDTLQVGKSIFYKIFEQLSGAKSKDARQGVIWVTKPLST
jgi:hypothetical protein